MGVMHSVIEKARKAAGISGMKKNYPDDPKHRGAGFWAAFIGSVSNDLGMVDQLRITASETSEKTVRAWATRVDEQQKEIDRLRAILQERGIDNLRLHEGWSVEKGREVLKTLAG
jgi:uncharacterized protein (DUF362 family)